MPKFIEHVGFDSKLFNMKVGRMEVYEEDVTSLSNFPSIEDHLKQSHSSGYRLLYIFGPTMAVQTDPTALSTSTATNQAKIPGKLVDKKTVYRTAIHSFDKNMLCSKAFLTNGIRIKRHNIASVPLVSDRLRSLAIASGIHSRFKVDDGIPMAGYEAMFTAWVTNSANRSLADEVFIAYVEEPSQEETTGTPSVSSSSTSNTLMEVGFITLRRRGNVVNVGLLAVSEAQRRRGIASALLSRAVLWSLEEMGHMPEAEMNVVTQGLNLAACSCYEKFGFRRDSVQKVYHFWLPHHLPESTSVSDQGLIPFCRHHFTGKEEGYVKEVLSSSIDSAARFTFNCAARMMELLGGSASDSERIVMVPSGTAALEMAALLCDLQPGDEVILPSYTFPSTANAFVLRGAVPVFVDVRIDTLNIDEALIESAITTRTKAICCVHYAGVACDMDTIMEIAHRHKLYVVEDAAQALMGTYKGRALGTIGHFGCFSFHYTKNIICGEGGALSVKRCVEPQVGQRAMVIWEKGTNRYDFMQGKVDKYRWLEVGSSFVPNEVSCAILFAQLLEAENITSRRLAHYRRYESGLKELADQGFFRIPTVPNYAAHNAHIFYLLFPSAARREYFQTELQSRGIACFTHYVPLHSSPAGRKYGRVSANAGAHRSTGPSTTSSMGSIDTVAVSSMGGEGEEDNSGDNTSSKALAVTHAVDGCLIRLPIWIDLTIDQIEYVIEAIKETASSCSI